MAAPQVLQLNEPDFVSKLRAAARGGRKTLVENCNGDPPAHLGGILDKPNAMVSR